MNTALPIICFWIGLICLIIAYIFKKKSFAPLVKQMSMAAFFIGFILFLWWAVLRVIGI